jgi:uncharacterized membrane protein
MAFRSHTGEIAGLPPSSQGYQAFSVVVLSNIDAPAIGPERLGLLRAFVRNGGGLIALGGLWAFDRGGYRGSILEEMLPVSMAEETLRAVAAGAALELTPAGVWPRNCDLAARPCAFLFHGLTARPGATVHMTAEKMPVLVSGTYGQGRVVACALTVNGDPPQEAIPFWEWRGWTDILAQAADWAAASRPLKSPEVGQSSRDTPPEEESYMELLTGEKRDTEALRRVCTRLTGPVANDFFNAWKENSERFLGDEQDALFLAMLPFARRDWAPALLRYLSGPVAHVSNRRSALVLLGASGGEQACRTLLAALPDPALAGSAARGLGLSECPGVRETLETAYHEALRRAESPENLGPLDPSLLADLGAEAAAEAALALYRLGADGAVERVAQTYAILHFYRRILRNSCKMPRWDDAVKRRWSQGKQLEAIIRRLENDAGPVPQAQMASFLRFGRAVKDPVAADWVVRAMEQSSRQVAPAAWLPMAEAEDGVIARLARTLAQELPRQE